MRVNEFEKGVSEKMEEFRLQPSAPVWPEVERRIRERKRRRILFFWFCLAGIILAGLGSWWIMDNKQPVSGTTNQVVAETLPGINKQEKNDNKSGSVSNHPVADNTTVTEKATTVNATPSASTPNPVPAAKVSTLNGIQAPAVSENKPGKSVKQSIPDPFKTVNASVTGGNGSKSKKTGNKPAVAKKGTAKPAPVTGTIVDVQTAAVPSAVEESTVTTMNEERKATATIVANKDNVPADSVKAIAVIPQQDPMPVSPKKKSGKPSKWQTGVQFGIGGSKITNGGFQLFSEKRFDAAMSGGGSVNTNPGGGTSFQSYADSIPLKGLSVQAGVFAKRKLGKRTAFSVGLNLAYYTAKQQVGTFVDSMLTINSIFSTSTRDGYYRAGGNSSYNNRYYYVQLPLLVHWQLNKGRKLPPIQWENGLAPSFLLGSKALVYDRSSRLFFRDKSAYSSFGLVFQTGLTAEFGTAKKHPLSAGLFYKYHFTRLQKISPPDFNYLGGFGLQVRWGIKK